MLISDGYTFTKKISVGEEVNKDVYAKIASDTILIEVER
jgi:hypothetical protein